MTYHIMTDVATSAGADVSAVAVLAPILAFLVVVIVLTAILNKSKILGDNIWISVFVSLFIAAIFVTFTSVRDLLLTAIPWFAVLLMALFFILVLTGLMGKTEDIAGKGLGWFFVIVLIAVFLIAGIKVYASTIGVYVPGPFYGFDGDPQILAFTDWFYSPPVIGAVGLIIAAVAVSFVLIKFSGD